MNSRHSAILPAPHVCEVSNQGKIPVKNMVMEFSTILTLIIWCRHYLYIIFSLVNILPVYLLKTDNNSISHVYKI